MYGTLSPETYRRIHEQALYSAVPRLVTEAYAKIGRPPKVEEAGVIHPSRLRLLIEIPTASGIGSPAPDASSCATAWSGKFQVSSMGMATLPRNFWEASAITERFFTSNADITFRISTYAVRSSISVAASPAF